MNIKVRKRFSRKREIFRSEARSVISGLTGLALYQLRTGNVPTIEFLVQLLTTYDALCESSKNKDIVQIRMRNEAEAALRSALGIALTFVESVAHEKDITALMLAGLELWRPSGRKRTAKKASAVQLELVPAPAAT